MGFSGQDDIRLSLGQRLLAVNWGLFLLIVAVASIGFAMLYSAAGGSYEPWAIRQMIRFAGGVVLMLTVAVIDLRVWMRYAYILYGLSLLLLVGVEVAGTVGMGAQRWINLGFIQLQPSELTKITLILALARYFHGLSYSDVGRIPRLIPPLLMIGAPMALVLRQPDLGTALLLAIGGVTICFLAGVRIWKFALAGGSILAALPVAWSYLEDYQKQRIYTFLDPERDPLGAGYHITQSKIALGSGGLFGKGFLQGTQSHLNFLPEMQTDFIFTMYAEEFGLFGGLALLGVYFIILAYGYIIALRCRSQFGRLLGLGIVTTFFLFVFINVAMVMGLVPVVGVPLPLISYGGTSMLTLMIGFGLLMSVSIFRDVQIPATAARLF